MARLRAMVTLDHDSALPEDVTVNTWHFLTIDPVTVPIAGSIANALESFYQANQANGNRVSQYLSSTLAGTGSIKVYNLADVEPRVPMHEQALTIVPALGDPLPEEVAIVLSYAAAEVSGLDQRNRRGRIYLGPLDADVASFDGSGVRVHATARDTIGQAATALANHASIEWDWAVYSPTLNSAAVVTDGFVSNAFGTMRSRGRAASSRTLWT